MECGQYQSALEVIETGVRTARQHDMTALLANALTTRGIVYRDLQAFEQARADHSEALAIIETLASPTIPLLLAGHLAADYALAGQWSQACTYGVKTTRLEDFSWLSLYGNAAGNRDRLRPAGIIATGFGLKILDRLGPAK